MSCGHRCRTPPRHRATPAGPAAVCPSLAAGPAPLVRRRADDHALTPDVRPARRTHWPAAPHTTSRASVVSQLEPPGLFDQVLSEAVVRALRHELEARALVDPAGVDEHVVGP